jgi:integral membrane protein
MKALFLLYRVLATVVGCSIITLVVVGIPLKYAYKVVPSFWPDFLEQGASGQMLGTHINMYLGIAHGFIYMAFVLVALILANESRWSLPFTVVTLLCGTVPFVSFWAEARAIKRVRSEHPEWAAPVQPAS